MKKFIILIVCLVILSSCSKREEKEELSETNFVNNKGININHKEINELIDNSLINGDTIAYRNISKVYQSADRFLELYLYAYIMAYEHEYGLAYFDLYIILSSSPYIGELKKPKVDEMSIYYLLKASELKHHQAKLEVKELFKGKDSIPKSELYLDKVMGSVGLMMNQKSQFNYLGNVALRK